MVVSYITTNDEHDDEAGIEIDVTFLVSYIATDDKKVTSFMKNDKKVCHIPISLRYVYLTLCVAFLYQMR